MVEHFLAKEDVASSSLVTRSTGPPSRIVFEEIELLVDNEWVTARQRALPISNFPCSRSGPSQKRALPAESPIATYFGKFIFKKSITNCSTLSPVVVFLCRNEYYNSLYQRSTVYDTSTSKILHVLSVDLCRGHDNLSQGFNA